MNYVCLFCRSYENDVFSFIKQINSHFSEIPSNSEENKENLNVCENCCGLFEVQNVHNYLIKVLDFLKSSKYQFEDFGINLTLPISIYPFLLKRWKQMNEIDENEKERFDELKQLFKTILGNSISMITSTKYDLKSSCVLKVVLTNQLDQENASMELSMKTKKSSQKGCCKYSRSSSLFPELQDDSFIKCSPFISEIYCCHEPIFISGRYNKYSRELSQTPWYVDVPHKTVTSVQELIANHFQPYCNGQIVFSASGREDIDVRMLGNGRPFALRCMDPFKKSLSSTTIEEIQKKINSSTSLIKVHNLALTTKAILEYLKMGEEKKNKTYSAIIVTETPISEEAISSFNSIKNLQIHQLTPIRVLHRRSLMTRTRALYSCSLKPINSQVYELKATTQAGMYIKELVHGDFGRTYPNLGSILKCSVDIIQLDVEDINIEFPSENK